MIAKTSAWPFLYFVIQKFDKERTLRRARGNQSDGGEARDSPYQRYMGDRVIQAVGEEGNEGQHSFPDLPLCVKHVAFLPLEPSPVAQNSYKNGLFFFFFQLLTLPALSATSGLMYITECPSHPLIASLEP